MQVARKPENEPRRLEYLHRLQILDTVAEQTFDDVTKIASYITGTPIALVSLVDEDRQWFKSRHGLDASETPRDVAFCAHAILQQDVFVVEDSLADARFHDNPLATGAPHVRFYAGMPLMTEDGLGLGTLCVIDHEPRRLADQQIECLRGLGRQILREFELRLMMNEMRRVDELKDDFISTVNHELRTPLTSIRGALSLVNSGKLESRPTGRVGQLLELAERNSLHLLALVNDLLDMQKIETEGLQLEIERCDFRDIVDDAVAMNSAYAADRTTGWQRPAEETIVAVDRRKIVQVIVNLLSNAVKFSPPGSRVRVEQQATTHGTRLSVTDEGCGIPASARERVFAKFGQVQSTAGREFKGTGLGLPIAKKLVEQHGGTIGFESQEGAGSTFFFELPLADRPAAAPR